MRTLLFSLIVLGLAIWAGVYLHNETGYVFIAFGKTTLEMPLWFFVLGVFLLCAIFILALKIIASILGAPYQLGRFYQRKKTRKARRQMREGFLALAEGRWKNAEKLLIKSASQIPNTLLSYLGAAIAAQHQGGLDRRDNYLRLAHASAKDSDVAVSLTQARLQIEQGQLEQGLATLQLLRQLSPKHDYVLTLLKDVYTSLGEWNALLELVKKMKHRKLISDDEAEKLQALAYSMILKNASNQGFSALEAAWHNIDRHLKHNTEVVSEYVSLLLSYQRNDMVEEILRDQLKKHWDDKLARQYGLISGKDPVKQLSVAEGWLKTHPNNAILFLTLGRISLKNQLWGKARQYLQKSIEFNPSEEAYLELATLALKHNDEKIDFAACVQEALDLASARSC
jgi:HemY protein